MAVYLDLESRHQRSNWKLCAHDGAYWQTGITVGDWVGIRLFHCIYRSPFPKRLSPERKSPICHMENKHVDFQSILLFQPWVSPLPLFLPLHLVFLALSIQSNSWLLPWWGEGGVNWSLAGWSRVEIEEGVKFLLTERRSNTSQSFSFPPSEVSGASTYWQGFLNASWI